MVGRVHTRSIIRLSTPRCTGCCSTRCCSTLHTNRQPLSLLCTPLPTAAGPLQVLLPLCIAARQELRGRNQLMRAYAAQLPEAELRPAQEQHVRQVALLRLFSMRNLYLASCIVSGSGRREYVTAACAVHAELLLSSWVFNSAAWWAGLAGSLP